MSQHRPDDSDLRRTNDHFARQARLRELLWTLAAGTLFVGGTVATIAVAPGDQPPALCVAMGLIAGYATYAVNVWARYSA